MVVSTVEKAQYMPQGYGVNPTAVGPAPLALMEMMDVANECGRYREIIMRNHFTTKGMNPTPKPTDPDNVAEIPLHVIKIIQSPSSPVRVQLWWPTFHIPREDLRHYLRYKPKPGLKPDDEFYFHPHKRIGGAGPQTPSPFVEIKYRTIAGDIALLCPWAQLIISDRTFIGHRSAVDFR